MPKGSGVRMRAAGQEPALGGWGWVEAGAAPTCFWQGLRSSSRRVRAVLLFD